MHEEMTLEDTVDLMLSLDWEDRFLAEYYQLQIRLKKLRKALLPTNTIPPKAVKLLSLQESAMSAYLATMKQRAELLGMDLDKGLKEAA